MSRNFYIYFLIDSKFYRYKHDSRLSFRCWSNFKIFCITQIIYRWKFDYYTYSNITMSHCICCIYIYVWHMRVCTPIGKDRSIPRIVYVNPPSAHFIFTFFSPLFYRNIFLSWFLLFAPVSDPPVVKQKTKIVVEKKSNEKTRKKKKIQICMYERERKRELTAEPVNPRCRRI